MFALPKTSPINPVVRARPFDHSDYLFELKYDGFRAMAYFENGTCDLVFPQQTCLWRLLRTSGVARSECSGARRDY